MPATLSTVAYIGATILFILSLGGLSSPESSRRGNLYGMIGMAIAVLATVLGPQVTKAGLPWILGAMLVGAAIGVYAARVNSAAASALVVCQPAADAASMRAGIRFQASMWQAAAAYSMSIARSVFTVAAA